MEKETCVVCSKPTIYNKFDHVDKRNYYVEGCGQLCPDCFNKVYTEKVENNNAKKATFLLG
jgi:hypothetical protein